MVLTGPISHTSIHCKDFLGFSMFHWICLLIILLILVGAELPLCVAVTLTVLECFNPFSGVKLSIRSFCFISYVEIFAYYLHSIVNIVVHYLSDKLNWF